ncbi:MAG: hypothetical protein ACHQIL_10550 [Steroidobacterales bacterium]
MKRNDNELQRSLGRLLTMIQAEEMRALDTPAWCAAHEALRRAENLYWAAKQDALAATLGSVALREYLGNAWLSRHPCVLPALQDLELSMDYVERQA